ncbi:MAG: BolA family transcriptional regulator [Alphaproteobacteria bacterium]|nr:BolA family transcriptional regulator [Alphaproteobacteria bacterium]
MTTTQARLSTILEDSFSPTHLAVRDDSHKHAGHAGTRPEGETHFHVTIVSEKFTGKSRVTRQRMVYEAVASLMNAPIHALQLFTFTPEEQQQA